MAFESLSDRFGQIFKKLRGQSRLSEANMDEMLKEIRVALLEADVNFKVVKSFVNDVKEKAIGQDVYSKVNPSQMVVKIVHDEIESLLGDEQNGINYTKGGLTTIMLVGLQGTGKTTTAGKLAYLMQKEGKKVMLGALDVYRPAAIDQLRTVSNDVDCSFFTLGIQDPVDIAIKAKEKALEEHMDVLILDTAGRLQIDETLMEELKKIKSVIDKKASEALRECILVLDANTGQNGLQQAKVFTEAVDVTCVALTKLDGSAKGAIVLSVAKEMKLPVKLIGVGEKMEDLKTFNSEEFVNALFN